MKTRVDNEASYFTCVVYDENNNELSWLIKPSVVCDKN